MLLDTIALELPILVLLLGSIPFLESRVAIPFALGSGVAPGAAISLGIAGNLLLVPISLLLIVGLDTLRPRWLALDRVMGRLDQRAGRQRDWVRRYGFLGLVVLVGIPIPGTGIWTGLAVARLLGLPLQSTALALSLGVVCAGLIVGAASLGLFSLFGGLVSP